MSLFRKLIITGCESRGDHVSPYLTRWYLLRTPWFQVFVHRFVRSDADDYHDHPWNFWTLILKGRYKDIHLTESGQQCPSILTPGTLAFRPASYRHRVELIDGNPVWTLVVTGPKIRDWGFIHKGQWYWWEYYFDMLGCWGFGSDQKETE